MAGSAQDRMAEEFVRGRYARRATALRPLAAGEWSRAYALELDGRQVVIRFGAHGDDYAKDALMAGFRGPDLPIPRVLEVGDAPGGRFAVSERAHGEELDALDGEGMRAALPALLRMLDAIAAVPVPPGAGYGGWGADRRAPHASWGDALLDVARPRPRLPGWRDRLKTLPDAARVFDAGLEMLTTLVPALPDERRIIHQDLLHHNVLVQGSRISAVLDWGNALYGDHLYDAAWLLYWWPWYLHWSDIDIRAEITRHWEGGGGQPRGRDQRLRCYLLHIGLDSMAYTAFTGRWDDLRRNSAQIRALL